jgi:hypothetical protein
VIGQAIANVIAGIRIRADVIPGIAAWGSERKRHMRARIAAFVARIRGALPGVVAWIAAAGALSLLAGIRLGTEQAVVACRAVVVDEGACPVNLAGTHYAGITIVAVGVVTAGDALVDSRTLADAEFTRVRGARIVVVIGAARLAIGVARAWLGAREAQPADALAVRPGRQRRGAGL